jgi:hypothetical protein
MTGGATDAGFANRSGKAVVVEGFGLAGFGYHARDEYIDTSSIVPRLYLMTRMLTELGRRSEGCVPRMQRVAPYAAKRNTDSVDQPEFRFAPSGLRRSMG